MLTRADQGVDIVTPKVVNGIRSKERIRDQGEVMTPPKIVEEMLDLIPPEAWATPAFPLLEPSCGSGNFVIAALERRINALKDNGTKTNTAIKQAFNTMFAVDICGDNIKETRIRAITLACLRIDDSKKKDTAKLLRNLIAIVRYNITKVPDTLQILEHLKERKYFLNTKGIHMKKALPLPERSKLLDEVGQEFEDALKFMAKCKASLAVKQSEVIG